MRDDIHTVEDLLRVIREEVPTSESIISTPFSSGTARPGENIRIGENEADIARRLILADMTTENGYSPSDKNRLDFIAKANRTEFQRLSQATVAAERQNRFR